MSSSDIPGLKGQEAARRSVVGAKVRVPRVSALARERLDAVMAQLWSRRLGLVVAPAGSGKTTLLAGFASSVDVPVAWYRAESWDGSSETFLGHLEAALAVALGGLPGGWATVEDAALAMESWAGRRAVLVMDDLHTLQGSPAEQTLGRLIEYAPSSMVFLAASRTQPRLNLSRLRVSGSLLEIDGDDLRFRSWEVERLFRDVYGAPLPPVELAQLARRTEGWAAGLQLFHLATRGKPPEERRRVLAGLASGSRFVRDYLTSNVLDELPGELRAFLLQTSMLGRLSGPICNSFLGAEGSDEILAELERRQVFTQALDDGSQYRYHEVLRSHLESVLVHELGEAVVRDRHRRAGEVLEGAGALPEALHAYCRAEDWLAADRLLGRNGAELVQRSGAWVELLPAGLLQNDPWLLLASARRLRADGLWSAAVDAYQRAEQAFAAREGAELARRERKALAVWLGSGQGSASGLVGALRAATRTLPMVPPGGASPLGAVANGVLAGLAALLAGEVTEARRALGNAAASPEASGALALSALLAWGVAGLLAGERASVGDLAAAAEQAEHLELGFLARLGHACLALGHGPDGVAEAAAVRLACERHGDSWGGALAGLLEGWARALSNRPCDLGEAAPLLEEVADRFERMDAPVLQAWARAFLALAVARVGGEQATALGLQAERLAQSRGADGAAAFAYSALAISDPGRRSTYLALAAAIQARTGLALPPVARQPSRPALSIRLLGGFSISENGVPLQLGGLKPRVRTLLRLLALQTGRPLHREVIVDLLWPEADAEAGARNLHVAMSSLRQALKTDSGGGVANLLVRDGDAYHLDVGEGADCDLLALERDLAAGRRARAAGDHEAAVASLRRALERYGGELLPEDGAAAWVLERRDRSRADAAEAARALSELLLESGDADAAALACASGLQVDRYNDPLWRLLVEARERAGDRVAASRARAEYHRVLAELGLEAVAPAIPA